MSYQTNLRLLNDLQRRPITKPVIHVVSGHSDDGCEGPHYRLDEWAGSAIFDRRYARGQEPAYHWRFNVINRPGLAVIVTPVYQPRTVEIEEYEKCRKRYPDWPWTSAAEDAECHALSHGSSNWTKTPYYLLRIVANQQRTIHGYLSAEDFAYVYLPDRELAQQVLDSLWAAVHGDPRAYAGAKHCAFCHHALTDALSSARGYGPDCAEKYGLPKVCRLDSPMLFARLNI